MLRQVLSFMQGNKYQHVGQTQPMAASGYWYMARGFAN